MSRYVQVASVQFPFAARPTNDSRRQVLEATSAAMDRLRGLGVELALFCEAVESMGQSVDEAEALARPGPFLNLYLEFARRERCVVAGSVKLREGGQAYNSLAFLGPDGPLGAYHKNFLIVSELESGLRPGPGAVCVDTPVGRLGGVICFDLNFARLRQEYRALRPDILCFASMYHGGLMQAMWAYECRAFFASALPFHGCGILDPFGRPVQLTDCYTSIARARINLDRVMVHLDFNREKFIEIERKYLGEVVIDTPPNVGSALLYSLTEKRTARDVAAEFKLRLLDDYFRDSIEQNDRAR